MKKLRFNCPTKCMIEPESSVSLVRFPFRNWPDAESNTSSACTMWRLKTGRVGNPQSLGDLAGRGSVTLKSSRSHSNQTQEKGSAVSTAEPFKFSGPIRLPRHPLPRSGLSFKFLFAAFQNFVPQATWNLAVCEEFHRKRPLTLCH